MVKRRKVIMGAGAAVAGLGLGSSTVASKKGGKVWKGVKEEPPGNAAVENVTYRRDGKVLEVDTGEWIKHQFGWLNRAGTKEEALEKFKQTEFTVKVDGEELDNVRAYFGDIEEYDGEFDQDYRWPFAAYTPPRSPGTYLYEIEANPPEKNLISVDGTYRVSPGR